PPFSTLFPYTTLFRSGLEPIANLGQGSPDDHAHRVVEVGALHLQLEVDGRDLVVRRVDLLAGDLLPRRGVFHISHEFSVPKFCLDRKSTRLNSSHVKI